MSKRKNPDLYAVVLSLLYVALGLVLVIWPENSAITICYAVGALVTLGGLFYIIAYFTQNHYSAILGQSLAVGLVLLVIGVFVLLHAENILKAMPFMIGVLLFFDSATKIQAALDLRRIGSARWNVPLIAGGVTALLGIVLMWNPFTAGIVLHIFIGVCLILNAVANLLSSLLISRRIKDAQDAPSEAQPPNETKE